MSPRAFKSEKTLYYECLSALDHGVYAADDILSVPSSQAFVYKGYLRP